MKIDTFWLIVAAIFIISLMMAFGACDDMVIRGRA